MKKKMILLGALLLFVTGFVSAQVCPPNNNGRTGYNTSAYNSFRNYNSASFTLDRLAFNFNSLVSEGYRNGNLTSKEIRGLERDFRNVEREMRWAYSDGRLSFHERSTIDVYMRRLQRNLSREWNDNDTRIG